MRRTFNKRVHKVKSRSGFSLIELLVVIFIITLLIAVLVPAVTSARQAGYKATSASNLRQLALALTQHNDAFGAFPYSVRNESLPAAQQPPRFGWAIGILPYLDRKDLYDRYDFKLGWQTPENVTVTNKSVEVFINPASPEPTRLDDKPEASPWNGLVSVTDYATITHVAKALFDGGYVDEHGEGAIPKNKKSSLADIRDGLTNTLLLVDSAGRPYHYIKGKRNGNPYDSGTSGGTGTSNQSDVKRVNGGGWSRNANDISLEGFTVTRTVNSTTNEVSYTATRTGPNAINVQNGEDVVPLGVSPNTTYYGSNGTGAPYSFHPGGINAAFADGSVRFINEKIDIRVLAKLVTRNGNEVVDELSY